MSDLVPEWRIGDLILTEDPFLVVFDGVDYGAVENATQILQSLLQDGDIELSNRTGNRTVALNILIEAADMAALAEAEAALIAECDKPRNELYVDPGDGWGAPFIFEVFRGQVTFDRNDRYERHGYRAYTLTFRALPFPRSVDEVTAEALAASGTTTTDLDTMGATTGWTATINGAAATITAAAGPPSTLTVSQSATKLAYLFRWTKTFAATTSSLKYLVVDWKPAPASDGLLLAYGDGVALTRIAEAASPTVGYTRTWFYVTASSLADLRFDWNSGEKNSNTARSISFDNIAISDVNPGIGTQRQQIRSVEVAGSVRTQGALTVESETAALGDTLVYVYPDGDSTSGYVPALRQYRSAGNSVTSDGTLLSGAREAIDAPGVTYEIPVAQLPRGAYTLLARLANSGGATPTISYTAQASLNGTNIGEALSGSRTITTTTAYQTFTIGRLNLPSVDFAEGSAAVIELTLEGSVTGTSIDEAWLFNTTIGQLIQVSCGTGSGAVGGSARRLFVEPATVGTPRPTVRVGHSADRSDSFFPTTMPSWQFPQFTPDAVNVFVSTSNATDAEVSLRHYPHWHTHAVS